MHFYCQKTKKSFRIMFKEEILENIITLQDIIDRERTTNKIILDFMLEQYPALQMFSSEFMITNRNLNYYKPYGLDNY